MKSGLGIKISLYRNHKRKAFGGISNLIIYPILVMMFGSILSKTIIVCIPSSQTQKQCVSPSGLPQNITNKQVVTLFCPIFNILCNIVCFIAGADSGTCRQAELDADIAAGFAVTSPNLGFTLPQTALQLITAAFNPSNGGFIALLIIGVGAVILVGVTIFGSGLNPASIYLAFMILMYVAIWSVLSITSGNIFAPYNSISNPVGMPIITDSQGLKISTGAVLYYILSIFYALGVIQ